MKINEDIYVLDLTSDIGFTKEEIYPVVLKDKDSLILIDTGYPGLLESIKSSIKGENLDINKLNKIILSHQDLDHIGTAKQLKEESNGVIKILAHEEEVDYIDGTKKPLKLALFEEKIKFMPKEAEKVFEGMKKGFEICKLKVDESLRDGEVIPVCEGVTVIHTPGHTIGHICLYLNKDKILIAGDTIGIEDGKLKLTDDMYNFNSEENERSVKKLLNYDIDKIICYHGGIFEGDVKKALKNLLS